MCQSSKPFVSVPTVVGRVPGCCACRKRRSRSRKAEYLERDVRQLQVGRPSIGKKGVAVRAAASQSSLEEPCCVSCFWQVQREIERESSQQNPPVSACKKAGCVDRHKICVFLLCARANVCSRAIYMEAQVFL